MKIRKLIDSLFLITLVFGIGLIVFILSKDSDDVRIPIVDSKKAAISIITPLTKEPLRNPIDLAVTSDGNIFITDSDNHRIQAFDRNGKFITSFGGYGAGEQQFNYPVGIVADSENNLYIADLYNQRISVFGPDGKFKFYIYADNAIPSAIAIDQSGHLYIIDKSDNTVKKLTRQGKVLLSFGGLGNDDAKFQYPLGIAVDKNGKIFVSDTGNNRIQVFNDKGNLEQIIKVPIGPPSGITVDSNSDIFFTEPTNGQVQTVDNEKSPKVLISTEELNQDGLFFPEGIEIKGKELFMTDKGNNQIIIYPLE
ncbi:NHL repeat-containing protein [Neobacillus sp. LXY-4]|uniref:NHL repeat-containing protein n=1 Tax=Neobacillus sp. LXY-4 TaxID=3379826 RepID=UPI003EE23B48